MSTAVSGVYRVIVIPFTGQEFREDSLWNNLPALVGSTTNVIVSAAGFGYQLFKTYSAGAFQPGKGVKIELWETTAGDAAIVANLPAFQTAVGRQIYTWSTPITWETV